MAVKKTQSQSKVVAKKQDTPQPKKERKPLVNWFSREKEFEYSDKKRGDYKRHVTTKVVKAPESVLSKGFEKKVVKERTVRPMQKGEARKNLNRGVGIALGGVGASMAGLMINAAVGESRKEKENDVMREARNKDKVSSDKFNKMTYEEQQKYHAKRDKNVSDAESGIAKKKERNEKVSKALIAAMPLSVTVGTGIAMKDKERYSKKTVTKVKLPRKK